MIKRKYKFVFDVKIVKITAFNDVLIDENKKIEKNSMIENDEFERVDDEMISEHIEKIFVNVSNNTSRRNSLRVCRVVNSVDYQAQNITFHQQRSASFIHILDEVLQTYEQLSHVQFSRIFAQFTLSEVIDRVNRSELNEIEWKYESSFSSEDFSKLKDSIFISSSSDFCQLFDLRVRTRSSSTSNNFVIQSS